MGIIDNIWGTIVRVADPVITPVIRTVTPIVRPVIQTITRPPLQTISTIARPVIQTIQRSPVLQASRIQMPRIQLPTVRPQMIFNQGSRLIQRTPLAAVNTLGRYTGNAMRAGTLPTMRQSLNAGATILRQTPLSPVVNAGQQFQRQGGLQTLANQGSRLIQRTPLAAVNTLGQYTGNFINSGGRLPTVQQSLNAGAAVMRQTPLSSVVNAGQQFQRQGGLQTLANQGSRLIQRTPLAAVNTLGQQAGSVLRAGTLPTGQQVLNAGAAVMRQTPLAGAVNLGAQARQNIVRAGGVQSVVNRGSQLFQRSPLAAVNTLGQYTGAALRAGRLPTVQQGLNAGATVLRQTPLVGVVNAGAQARQNLARAGGVQQAINNGSRFIQSTPLAAVNTLGQYTGNALRSGRLPTVQQGLNAGATLSRQLGLGAVVDAGQTVRRSGLGALNPIPAARAADLYQFARGRAAPVTDLTRNPRSGADPALANVSRSPDFFGGVADAIRSDPVGTAVKTALLANPVTAIPTLAAAGVNRFLTSKPTSAAAAPKDGTRFDPLAAQETDMSSAEIRARTKAQMQADYDAAGGLAGYIGKTVGSAAGAVFNPLQYRGPDLSKAGSRWLGDNRSDAQKGRDAARDRLVAAGAPAGVVDENRQLEAIAKQSKANADQYARELASAGYIKDGQFQLNQDDPNAAGYYAQYQGLIAQANADAAALNTSSSTIKGYNADTKAAQEAYEQAQARAGSDDRHHGWFFEMIPMTRRERVIAREAEDAVKAGTPEWQLTPEQRSGGWGTVPVRFAHGMYSEARERPAEIFSNVVGTAATMGLGGVPTAVGRAVYAPVAARLAGTGLATGRAATVAKFIGSKAGTIGKVGLYGMMTYGIGSKIVTGEDQSAGGYAERVGRVMTSDGAPILGAVGYAKFAPRALRAAGPFVAPKPGTIAARQAEEAAAKAAANAGKPTFIDRVLGRGPAATKPAVTTKPTMQTDPIATTRRDLRGTVMDSLIDSRAPVSTATSPRTVTPSVVPQTTLTAPKRTTAIVDAGITDARQIVQNNRSRAMFDVFAGSSSRTRAAEPAPAANAAPATTRKATADTFLHSEKPAEVAASEAAGASAKPTAETFTGSAPTTAKPTAEAGTAATATGEPLIARGGIVEIPPEPAPVAPKTTAARPTTTTVAAAPPRSVDAVALERGILERRIVEQNAALADAQARKTLALEDFRNGRVTPDYYGEVRAAANGRKARKRRRTRDLDARGKQAVQEDYLRQLDQEIDDVSTDIVSLQGHLARLDTEMEAASAVSGIAAPAPAARPAPIERVPAPSTARPRTELPTNGKNAGVPGVDAGVEFEAMPKPTAEQHANRFLRSTEPTVLTAKGAAQPTGRPSAAQIAREERLAQQQLNAANAEYDAALKAGAPEDRLADLSAARDEAAVRVRAVHEQMDAVAAEAATRPAIPRGEHAQNVASRLLGETAPTGPGGHRVTLGPGGRPRAPLREAAPTASQYTAAEEIAGRRATLDYPATRPVETIAKDTKAADYAVEALTKKRAQIEAARTQAIEDLRVGKVTQPDIEIRSPFKGRKHTEMVDPNTWVNASIKKSIQESHIADLEGKIYRVDLLRGPKGKLSPENQAVLDDLQRLRSAALGDLAAGRVTTTEYAITVRGPSVRGPSVRRVSTADLSPTQRLTVQQRQVESLTAQLDATDAALARLTRQQGQLQYEMRMAREKAAAAPAAPSAGPVAPAAPEPAPARVFRPTVTIVKPKPVRVAGTSTPPPVGVMSRGSVNLKGAAVPAERPYFRMNNAEFNAAGDAELAAFRRDTPAEQVAAWEARVIDALQRDGAIAMDFGPGLARGQLDDVAMREMSRAVALGRERGIVFTGTQYETTFELAPSIRGRDLAVARVRPASAPTNVFEMNTPVRPSTISDELVRSLPQTAEHTRPIATIANDIRAEEAALRQLDVERTRLTTQQRMSWPKKRRTETQSAYEARINATPPKKLGETPEAYAARVAEHGQAVSTRGQFTAREAEVTAGIDQRLARIQSLHEELFFGKPLEGRQLPAKMEERPFAALEQMRREGRVTDEQYVEMRNAIRDTIRGEAQKEGWLLTRREGEFEIGTGGGKFRASRNQPGWTEPVVPGPGKSAAEMMEPFLRSGRPRTVLTTKERQAARLAAKKARENPWGPSRNAVDETWPSSRSAEALAGVEVDRLGGTGAGATFRPTQLVPRQQSSADTLGSWLVVKQTGRVRAGRTNMSPVEDAINASLGNPAARGGPSRPGRIQYKPDGTISWKYDVPQSVRSGREAPAVQTRESVRSVVDTSFEYGDGATGPVRMVQKPRQGFEAWGTPEEMAKAGEGAPLIEEKGYEVVRKGPKARAREATPGITLKQGDTISVGRGGLATPDETVLRTDRFYKPQRAKATADQQARRFMGKGVRTKTKVEKPEAVPDTYDYAGFATQHAGAEFPLQPAPVRGRARGAARKRSGTLEVVMDKNGQPIVVSRMPMSAGQRSQAVTRFNKNGWVQRRTDTTFETDASLFPAEPRKLKPDEAPTYETVEKGGDPSSGYYWEETTTHDTATGMKMASVRTEVMSPQWGAKNPPPELRSLTIEQTPAQWQHARGVLVSEDMPGLAGTRTAVGFIREPARVGDGGERLAVTKWDDALNPLTGEVETTRAFGTTDLTPGRFVEGMMANPRGVTVQPRRGRPAPTAAVDQPHVIDLTPEARIEITDARALREAHVLEPRVAESKARLDGIVRTYRLSETEIKMAGQNSWKLTKSKRAALVAERDALGGQIKTLDNEIAPVRDRLVEMNANGQGRSPEYQQIQKQYGEMLDRRRALADTFTPLDDRIRVNDGLREYNREAQTLSHLASSQQTAAASTTRLMTDADMTVVESVRRTVTARNTYASAIRKGEQRLAEIEQALARERANLDGVAKKYGMTEADIRYVEQPAPVVQKMNRADVAKAHGSSSKYREEIQQLQDQRALYEQRLASDLNGNVARARAMAKNKQTAQEVAADLGVDIDEARWLMGQESTAGATRSLQGAIKRTDGAIDRAQRGLNTVQRNLTLNNGRKAYVDRLTAIRRLEAERTGLQSKNARLQTSLDEAEQIAAYYRAREPDLMAQIEATPDAITFEPGVQPGLPARSPARGGVTSDGQILIDDAARSPVIDLMPTSTRTEASDMAAGFITSDFYRGVVARADAPRPGAVVPDPQYTGGRPRRSNVYSDFWKPEVRAAETARQAAVDQWITGRREVGVAAGPRHQTVEERVAAVRAAREDRQRRSRQVNRWYYGDRPAQSSRSVPPRPAPLAADETATLDKKMRGLADSSPASVEKRRREAEARLAQPNLAPEYRRDVELDYLATTAMQYRRNRRPSADDIVRFDEITGSKGTIVRPAWMVAGIARPAITVTRDAYNRSMRFGTGRLFQPRPATVGPSENVGVARPVQGPRDAAFWIQRAPGGGAGRGSDTRRAPEEKTGSGRGQNPTGAQIPYKGQPSINTQIQPPIRMPWQEQPPIETQIQPPIRMPWQEQPPIETQIQPPIVIPAVDQPPIQTIIQPPIQTIIEPPVPVHIIRTPPPPPPYEPPPPVIETPPPPPPIEPPPPPPYEPPPPPVGGGLGFPIPDGGGGGGGGGAGGGYYSFEERAAIKTPLQIVSDLIGYKTKPYKTKTDDGPASYEEAEEVAYEQEVAASGRRATAATFIGGASARAATAPATIVPVDGQPGLFLVDGKYYMTAEEIAAAQPLAKRQTGKQSKRATPAMFAVGQKRARTIPAAFQVGKKPGKATPAMFAVGTKRTRTTPAAFQIGKKTPPMFEVETKPQRRTPDAFRVGRTAKPLAKSQYVTASGQTINTINTPYGPVAVMDVPGASERAAVKSARRINDFIGGPGERTSKHRFGEFGDTGREYAVTSKDRHYQEDPEMSARASAVHDLVGRDSDGVDRDRYFGFNRNGTQLGRLDRLMGVSQRRTTPETFGEFGDTGREYTVVSNDPLANPMAKAQTSRRIPAMFQIGGGRGRTTPPAFAVGRGTGRARVGADAFLGGGNRRAGGLALSAPARARQSADAMRDRFMGSGVKTGRARAAAAQLAAGWPPVTRSREGRQTASAMTSVFMGGSVRTGKPSTRIPDGLAPTVVAGRSKSRAATMAARFLS